ncbi:MAG: XTP/dITP diphosphatase [Candidatus Hadarchaeum sp.]|uniref:XTP/dITP diphosphatase n=1 Tax=Candidatus Hadarchaeum sp. TaxID=2883567 RepID=UPI00317BB952
MALIFVTSNQHKFSEVNELARRRGVEIVHYKWRYTEIQSDDLEEIARASVMEVCTKLGKPCFVEDAGLFVNALNGFPGPYSNYVFRTIGNPGIIKLMAGFNDRSAEFRSAVAYCEPGKEPMVFVGRVKGKMAEKARGTGGFGFDPIFVPCEGNGRTFAEMTVSEKNLFSHRARAVDKFLNWFIEVKG